MQFFVYICYFGISHGIQPNWDIKKLDKFMCIWIFGSKKLKEFEKTASWWWFGWTVSWNFWSEFDAGVVSSNFSVLICRVFLKNFFNLWILCCSQTQSLKISNDKSSIWCVKSNLQLQNGHEFERGFSLELNWNPRETQLEIVASVFEFFFSISILWHLQDSSIHGRYQCLLFLGLWIARVSWTKIFQHLFLTVLSSLLWRWPSLLPQCLFWNFNSKKRENNFCTGLFLANQQCDILWIFDFCCSLGIRKFHLICFKLPLKRLFATYGWRHVFCAQIPFADLLQNIFWTWILVKMISVNTIKFSIRSSHLWMSNFTFKQQQNSHNSCFLT